MKPSKPFVSVFFLVLFFVIGCGQGDQSKQSEKESAVPESASLDKSRQEIQAVLDSFNVAAATADYDRYFGYFSPDAVFIGTDATEHWDLDSFKLWAKPHFDKKQTWNFLSISRNIYFDKTGKTAWFDELLSTQMKLCRGSGVLVRDGKTWKISQYVLSMTIPNSRVDDVVQLKSKEEDKLMQEMTR